MGILALDCKNSRDLILQFSGSENSYGPGPWHAFGLLATSLPIGLPMRAAHTSHAKPLGLGSAQNNLHLPFSFFDSARTGDQKPVLAVV